jgi:hypothetical protein
MAIKVIEATPQVIDTIKKASVLVNSGSDSYQKSQKADTKVDFKNLSSPDSNLIAARVVSGDGIKGYTCDIYGDGIENPPTKRGIVYLPNGRFNII